VDQDLYDKFACWCEKSTKRKADAIKHAQTKLHGYGQLILKYKGGIDSGNVVTRELKTKLDTVLGFIAKFTAMRTKQNGNYQAKSAELMQALAALENAIITLHEATKEPEDKASLLQDTSSAWQKATAGVQAAVIATPASAKLSPERERQLSAFLQGGAAGSSPQSATIQGILKDMYDSMATELEGLVHDEATQNTQFEELSYVKIKQKNDHEEDYERNARQIAEWEVLLADVQLLYAETEKQMKADTEVLDDTKEMCDAKYEEFMERKGLRAEEIDGIEEALKILTDKDNKALFGKAIKPGMEPSFLQISNVVSEGAANMRAYRALKEQSKKTHSLRLAALAATVRMAAVGHFGEVIGAIDKMIGVLKDEEADDIQQRDDCKSEYQHVASTVAELEWAIEKNEKKIKALEEAIAAREDEKVEALEDIEKTKEDIAKMEDTRKEENEDFLAGKKDDEDAIPVLKAALEAMTKYYKKNKIPLGPIQGDVKSLLQEREPEFEKDPDKAPDATLAGKGKRKGQSKGIISILTMIIEDLQGEIKTAIAEEEKAQAEFEKAVAAAKNVIADLEAKVNELKDIIATRKEEVVTEKDLKSTNEEELDSTHEHKKKITPDCDWILDAFEERKGKRAAEMEGLTKAKEYLAGAKPSLLQVAPTDAKTEPKSFFEGLPTASAFLPRY
jgi:hypothetical protein